MGPSSRDSAIKHGSYKIVYFGRAPSLLLYMNPNIVTVLVPFRTLSFSAVEIGTSFDPMM